MNFQKSKITTVLIAALLLVSIGASLLATASAVTYNNTTKTTFAYVTTMPHNVGVGDKITIYSWINQIFPNAGMTNDYRFHNYTVVITKPDNRTETLTAATISDTTSNQAFSYTPDITGTYTVNFYFPETNVNATSHVDDATANDVYLASTDSCTFTVQETSIGNLPDSYPLPSEYWTRPIYGENSYWYTISSNWLGFGSPNYQWISPSSYGAYYGGNGQQYPSDAVGSLTNHIMWTKSLQSGGVVGGDTGTIYGNTYFDGSAYDVRYENPIIVNGYLIYTEPLGYASKASGDTVSVDLRTGQELWRSSTMGALSFALITDLENGNQHGQSNALLVGVSGTTWRFFDADTGKALFNATNVPTSGAKAMGPNNEFLYYTVTNQTTGWTLGEWNSTKLWSQGTTGTVANLNSVVAANTANRYEWNYPITYNNANLTTTQSFKVLAAYYDDYMLCMNGTFPSTGSNMFFGSTETYAPYTYFLVNLNASKGTVGSIQWINTITPENKTTVVYSGIDTTNRVFVEGSREGLYWTGYSIDNGSQLWTTAAYPQDAMDYYGSQASGSLTNSFYCGYMYSSAYSGIVYAYDTATGALVWTYGNGGEGNSTDSGFAVPGNYPTFVSGFGQGVVYTLSSEHTIETPIYKGALERALNATTGQEIWTLSGYTNEFGQGAFAIGDGFNTWFNGYDNSIYVVGRGASQTTVSAPQTQITTGNKVVIQGTVMDLSAGTTQAEQKADFPAGVPVASDASMKDWMAYVYQQKPAPTNFTGVTVTIMALDPNSNYVVLGTTTTDANGIYHLTWTTPDVPGDYTVYAVFAGTNGYWGSKAEANVVVTEPAATVAPTTTPQSAADLYFIPAVAGIIIAIVIVMVLVALVLLKKP
jgi:PQQ enzyme repeat.